MSAIGQRDFDRIYSLDELITASDRPRVRQALQKIVDTPINIIDREGHSIIGDSTGGNRSTRVGIVWELEEVGYLEVEEASAGKTEVALEWLQIYMKASARYLMAADLHHAAIAEDYEVLQEKHAKLMESEQRYRDLSEQLEHRVSEQVKTIESAQRSLYQNEKLASVGRLAAGVAHEINNPIGFMRSNLTSARDYLKSVEEFRGFLASSQASEAYQRKWKELELDELLVDFDELLEESIDGADRIARIVADLKLFSRIDQASTEDTNLNEVLGSTCAMIHTQLPSEVELQQQFDELPLYSCSPALMGEIFFNLLKNAVQAIEGRGRVTVSSRSEGDSIEIRIADTGVGIPEEIRDKIFDPFFTTRMVGEGTGLGMTVAGEVVKDCGGDINIESEIKKGTTVVIRLPLVKAESGL